MSDNIIMIKKRFHEIFHICWRLFKTLYLLTIILLIGINWKEMNMKALNVEDLGTITWHL